MADQTNSTDQQRNRWRTFSLRSLFVLITVVAVGLGVLAHYRRGSLVKINEITDFGKLGKRYVVLPVKIENGDFKELIMSHLPQKSGFRQWDVLVLRNLQTTDNEEFGYSIHLNLFLRRRLQGWNMVSDFEGEGARERNEMMYAAIDAAADEIIAQSQVGSED